MEQENIDFQAAFINMLGEHPILFKNSQLPEARRQKSAAIENIQQRCAEQFNKTFTEAQISKRIMNLKSRVRMKIAVKRSAGKPINLKSWERQLVSIMQRNKNTHLNRLQEFPAASTSADSDIDTNVTEDMVPAIIIDCPVSAGPVEAAPEPLPCPTTPTSVLQQLETEKTQNLSLPELQRYVLLTQQKVLETQLKYLEKKSKILDLREKALRTLGAENAEAEEILGTETCKEEPLYKDEMYNF